MSPAKPAVRVENYSCRYGKDDPLRLKKISLEVWVGEFVGIVGPSGGGKSTLAYATNGIVPHEIRGSETAGDIFVMDLKVSENPPHELVRQVGTVLQDPEWQLVTFTVADEIAVGLENLGVDSREIQRRVSRSAELLGLEHLLNHSPDELSGGQKQRVAIAACLALSPPVLLLDEPLSELDPTGKEGVIRAVRELNEEHGITVLFVEHNLDAISPYADRIVVVVDGEVIANGPPRQVLSDREVLDATGFRAPQPIELANLLPPALRPETPPLTMGELAGTIAGADSLNLGALPSVGQEEDISPDAGKVVVEARGLHYRYPGGHEAVQGVDLTLREGEYLGLIGQNGAGKSTLVRLLAGLLKPSKGVVFLGGRSISHLSRKEITARIGYVFQNPDFQFFKDTCFEEVAFGLRLQGLSEKEVEERAMSALSQLEVESYRDEHPHFLSRGQRRRVAIATVLALAPGVILLDEPTTGLDSGTASRLLDVIDGLREEGHSVVMLTHEMPAVLERCDRLVLVHEGQILLDDDPRRAFLEREVMGACHIRPPPLADLFGSLGWNEMYLLPRTNQEAASFIAGHRDLGAPVKD